MKFLRTFENFEEEEKEIPYKSDAFESPSKTCGSCEDEEEKDDIELEDDEIITLEKKANKKGKSYKKSGLKNPEKADLNKDKKISPYEKKRGKAIEDSMEDSKEDGLTDKQKKLPEGLLKAIKNRNKKKKKK